MAKKLLCLCLVLSMFFIISIPGMAYSISADAVTVTKSNDGAYTVVVSNPVYANAEVTFTAVANGCDIPESLTDASLAYFYSEKANADGEVTFTFEPKDGFDNSKGLYVAVSARGVDTIIKRAELTVNIKSEYGTVTPSSDKIYEGDEVAFKVIPKYGYNPTKAIVNDAPIPLETSTFYCIATNNLNILVEYNVAPAAIGGVAVFGDTINPDEFAEKYGEDMTEDALSAKYAAVIFSKVSSLTYECGIVYSKTNDNPTKDGADCKVVKSEKVGSQGAFGMYLFTDIVDTNTYYVRSYVKSGDTYIYGDVTTFSLSAVSTGTAE